MCALSHSLTSVFVSVTTRACDGGWGSKAGKSLSPKLKESVGASKAILSHSQTRSDFFRESWILACSSDKRSLDNQSHH